MISDRTSPGFRPKSKNKDQAKDTGMALVLIVLIYLYLAEGIRKAIWPALILFVTMAVPVIFRPLASLWFGLAHIVGTVMTKFLLSVIFLVIVVPIGLFRRIFLGSDAMENKAWKTDTTSVFKTRDHVFSAEDMETPF
jgi:hypothetical protein